MKDVLTPKILRDVMAANERIRQRQIAQVEWLEQWCEQDRAEFERLLDKYDERKRVYCDLDRTTDERERARDMNETIRRVG